MKTHLLFDFDGTLVNSHDHNQQLFIETFLPFVPDIDEARVREVHELGVGEAMDLLFERVNQTLALNLDVKTLVEENEKLHVQRFDQVKAFEKTSEFLEKLKLKDKKLYICTNRNTESIMKMLEANDLIKYFDKIISCYDAGFPKPDPTCINNIVKESGEDKDNFVYFGDSYVDKNFAQNAEIDFLILDQRTHDRRFFEMILEIFM